MLRGIDISNHQGPPVLYRGVQWYRDASFVIVQAINPPKPFSGWDVGGYTAAQLRAAREDGKKIGVYVWLWNTLADTRSDIRARLALIPEDLPLDMRLWLDVEDVATNSGPSRQDDVLAALEVMDAWSYAHGLPATGIYSGDWYISGYMGGWFPEGRLYWLADYGLTPTVLPMRPIHQYTSAPIDLNIMLESELVGGDTPPPDQPDECDWGWVAKKDLVVSLAGELAGDVSIQLLAEANRKGGPRVTQVRRLANAEVRPRAERILA